MRLQTRWLAGLMVLNKCTYLALWRVNRRSADARGRFPSRVGNPLDAMIQDDLEVFAAQLDETALVSFLAHENGCYTLRFYVSKHHEIMKPRREGMNVRLSTQVKGVAGQSLWEIRKILLIY